MDAQLKRGIAEVCVLAVLRSGDSYGYQIVKDISPHMPISESTLYPILKRLELSGFVSVYSVEHNSRLRKYYRITPHGHQRISAFVQEWHELLDIATFIKSTEKIAEEGGQAT